MPKENQRQENGKKRKKFGDGFDWSVLTYHSHWVAPCHSKYRITVSQLFVEGRAGRKKYETLCKVLHNMALNEWLLFKFCHVASIHCLKPNEIPRVSVAYKDESGSCLLLGDCRVGFVWFLLVMQSPTFFLPMGAHLVCMGVQCRPNGRPWAQNVGLYSDVYNVSKIICVWGS